MLQFLNWTLGSDQPDTQLPPRLKFWSCEDPNDFSPLSLQDTLPFKWHFFHIYELEYWATGIQLLLLLPNTVCPQCPALNITVIDKTLQNRILLFIMYSAASVSFFSYIIWMEYCLRWITAVHINTPTQVPVFTYTPNV